MDREHMNSGPNSLDHIIDAILEQLRAGKQPVLEDFITSFPKNASEIREMFPALVMAERIKQDSLQGGSTARTQPPKGSTEHHLLLGVLALQCGLIDRVQFSEAFEQWNSDRSRSFQSVLVDNHFLKNEACELLNRLADQQLENNDLLDFGLSHVAGGGRTHVFSGSPQSRSAEADSGFSVYESLPPSNRFEFLRPLDRGGLGIVSVALDTELNREVAFKEIRDDRVADATLRQKFWLEAQLTGGLEHPGIIPIYGLGKSASGKPYYAMRLIKGSNLHVHVRAFHERVQQGKTEFDGQSLRRILRRFLDVCEAISYAHSRGVLHRDLKPANIMLGSYGETLVVDWGLAKAMGISSVSDSQLDHDGSVMAVPETPIRRSSSDAESTRHGSIVGTPSYAPPEQLSGHLDLVEIRSDVYGLGAILYEILTGQPPAAGSLLEVIRTITTGKVRPARVVNTQVPKSLDAVCRKAMSLAPNDRYDTANELRADVERWLDDAPVRAFAEPVWIRCRRWIRKHPTLSATVSAVFLMSLVGLSTLSFIVTRNNSKLEKLNLSLDSKNSELVGANQTLAQLNHQLDESNVELSESNLREIQSKKIAQQQSELALSTLNAVILDIQLGLKNVSGGANIRRRILSTSLAKLEKVASEVVSQSRSERSTLKALLDLGEIILQMGTDSAASYPGQLATTKITSKDGQSASKIALSAYQRAYEIATTLLSQMPNEPQAKQDLLSCCRILGNLHLRLGDSETAAKYFEQCLVTSEELVADEPSNLQYQYLKALFNISYGDFLAKTNKITEALKAFQSSLDDYRRLLVLEPSNQIYESGLCTALEYLGGAEAAVGNLKLAAEYLKECQERRTDRYAAMPSDPMRRRDLIIALGKEGELHLEMGDLEKAVESAGRVVVLHQEAINQEPLNIQSRVDLANTLDRRAKLATRMGKSDEAIQFLSECMEIRERLAEKDPMDLFRKRDLSVSYDNLGKAEMNRGNMDLALALLRKGLQLSREVSANDPGNTFRKRDIGLSLASCGRVLLKQGKSVDAMECFTESLDLFKQLVDADPENKTKQRDWLIAVNRIADVHVADGRLEEALLAYQSGLELARKQSQEKPEFVELKRDLSIWLEQVGDIYKRQSNASAALEPFTENLQIRESLLLLSPTDVRSKLDVAGALDNVGTVLGMLERYEESAEYLTRSVSLNKAVSDPDPNNLEAMRDLATVQMKLGVTHTHQGKLFEALKELSESQATSVSLMKANPTAIEWTKDWIEVTKALANAEELSGKIEESIKQWQSCLEILDRMMAADQDGEWATREKEIANLQIEMLTKR